MNNKHIIFLFLAITGASCRGAGSRDIDYDYGRRDVEEVYLTADLESAFERGNYDYVNKILDQLKNEPAYFRNKVLSKVREPLIMAASKGWGDVVQKLIKLGVNVHEIRRNGETALGLAAQRSRSDNIIEQLIKAGADFNAELKKAIDKNDRNIIIRLLNNGATTYALTNEDKEKLISMGIRIDEELGG